MSKGNDIIKQIRQPIKGLVGWREPTDKEYKMICGLLLKEAGSDKKLSGIVNAIFIITIILCFNGMKSIIGFFPIAWGRKDIFDIVLFCFILLCLGFIICFLTKTLIDELKHDGDNKYIEAIKTKNLKVCDVIITDIKSFRGLNHGTGGHSAYVKDKAGNVHNDTIPLSCLNGYQKTEAILIEIYTTDGDELRSHKRVVPCEKYDPKLWEIAFKRLANMKKKP